MVDIIRKIGYFLCIIDETPQLNLADVAFIIILGKIIVATTVDWASLATLAIAVLNQMHNRQTVTSPDIMNMTKQIENLQNTVTSLKAQL